MNVAIVIPTYNEKETLPTLTEKLFGEIGPLVDELHVGIVDDSSPDGTADISIIQRPKKNGAWSII